MSVITCKRVLICIWVNVHCAYVCVCVHVHVVDIIGLIIDWYGVCVTLGISCNGSALSKHLTPNFLLFFSKNYWKRGQQRNSCSIEDLPQRLWRHSVFIHYKVSVRNSHRGRRWWLHRMYLVLLELLLFHSSLVCVSLSKVL